MHIEEVQNARKRISKYIQKTRLLHAKGLERNGFRLFLKCENEQITGSFKVRAALNTLLNLNDEDRKRGVVARSSGNFANGMAFAGQLLKIPVTIVMPIQAPERKKEGVRYYGGNLVVHGRNHAESQAKVDELAKDEGLLKIHSYDHLDVIYGNGSIGLEVREELPSFRHFFTSCSGGGLSGGCAFTLKSFDPKVETITVEPEGAGDFFLSKERGEKVQLRATHSIADGLLAPTVGQLNWPILLKYIDRAMLVTDREIIEAMRHLYTKFNVIAEPSGAATVAAFLKHPNLKGDAVAVVSGGNVDLDKFHKWVD